MKPLRNKRYETKHRATITCSSFIEPKVTFRVENNTTKDLQLLFFHESGLLDDSISLQKSGHYESSNRCRPGNNEDLTPFNTETDSIIVRFEDGRILEYYCDGIVLFKNFDKCRFEKNLMDFETRNSKRKKLSDNTTKTITFDESDYQKATFP